MLLLFFEIRLFHCKIETVAVFKVRFVENHFPLSLSLSLSFLSSWRKTAEKKRKQFQQQQKRREKFIGQIFSLVLFYFGLAVALFGVLFYSPHTDFVMCAFEWDGKQINRCLNVVSFETFFLWFIQNVLHFLDYFDAFTTRKKNNPNYNKHTHILAFNHLGWNYFKWIKRFALTLCRWSFEQTLEWNFVECIGPVSEWKNEHTFCVVFFSLLFNQQPHNQTNALPLHIIILSLAYFEYYTRCFFSLISTLYEKCWRHVSAKNGIKTQWSRVKKKEKSCWNSFR